MDHIGGLARGRARVGSRRVRHPAAERAAAGIPVRPTSSRRPTSRRSRRACATAPKAETPKPLVEKIAEAKPVENPTAKVVDKPEIVADRRSGAAASPSRSRRRPSRSRRPPQAKPEPKQAFAKEPEPKVDPIAEALKKDNKPEKKPEKKAETPTPQKKAEPPKPQPKFDADAHRGAARQARPAAPRRDRRARSSNTPSLGTATGRARRRCRRTSSTRCARGCAQCWNVPVGLADARDLVVTVRIQFKQDGSLLGRAAR